MRRTWLLIAMLLVGCGGAADGTPAAGGAAPDISPIGQTGPATIPPIPPSGFALADVGERAVGGMVALTVNAVRDPYLGIVASGRTYAALDVTVEDVGPVPVECPLNALSLIDAESGWHAHTDDLALRPPLPCARLFPGGHQRGWIAYAVPPSPRAAALRYDPPGGVPIVIELTS